MGTGFRRIVASGLAAAGLTAPSAHAGDRRRVDVVVGVAVRAAVSPATLSRALDVATRVYAAAGVRVAFVPTSDMLSTDATYRRLLIVVSSAPIGLVTDHALGFTGRSTDQPGHAAYVFHDDVVKTAVGRVVATADLLGYAIAHELGHMLLPAGHDDEGVMRAMWAARDFDAIRKGSLTIGTREAAAILSYLASADQLRQSTGPSPMGADWDRLEATYHEAVALAPSERSAFLDRVCGGDAALRTEVERLLTASGAVPRGSRDRCRTPQPMDGGATFGPSL